MRAMPMIGLTGSINGEENDIHLLLDYVTSVQAAGALPVMLPYCMSPEERREALSRVDGLLLTGGVDVDPALFGEAPIPELGEVSRMRDALEIPLARDAAALDLPIFGICRGIQLYNVALGGSLYQDLQAQHEGSERFIHARSSEHPAPRHDVRVLPASPLASILGAENAVVNTFHHQAIKTPAPGLVPCAWSPDGVIEAAYAPDARFTLLVQWHPERMYRTDDAQLALFRAFTDACAAYMRKRN